MARPSPKFKFGPWLPDQPDLDNAGLIEARNTISSAGYQAYKPLAPVGSAINGPYPLSAYRASGNGGSLLYAAGLSFGQTYLSVGDDGASWTNVTPVGGLAAAPSVCFTQYGNYVIATTGIAADHPVYNVLTTGTPFTKLTGPYGDAPIAKICGTIGQFVLLGNLPGAGPSFDAGLVQWSGIDAPLNWPTPNSATAIAQQSGQQFLNHALGAIEGISQGDQWGLILCDGGYVRVTYVGGDVVFQFDTIYRAPVAFGPNCWIKVEGRVYSVGPAGFTVCNGVDVEKIGYGKVDQWFLSNADLPTHPWNVACGADYKNKLIYWTFPLNGNSGVPNHWIAYNYLEKTWTHGDDVIQCYVQANEAWENRIPIEGFDGTNSVGIVGRLTGTPGISTFITGETELNPGGTALVFGIRPQVAGTTPDKITLSVGARNNQTDDTPVVFTTGGAIDAFTGQSDFMVDARYHRAKFEIQGAYTKAIGGEFDAQPTSNG